MRFPCVHAAATTPVQQMGVVLAHSPIRVSLPRFHCRVGLHIVLFEACSAFTRVAACTLARSPYFVTRYPKASDISSPPCLLRLLPAGAMSPGGPRTHWKAPPWHGAPPFETLVDSHPNRLKRVVWRHLVEPGKDGVVRYSNGRTGAADHAARASSDVRMRELRRCGWRAWWVQLRPGRSAPRSRQYLTRRMPAVCLRL